MIKSIDTRQAKVRELIADLRRRLSPSGNVVSEAGRRRTMEVFGEALSPAQVVRRICEDVRSKGLASVLDYSARIDKAQLTADTIRVPAAELKRAHAEVEAEFLGAVRRIRENILRFQLAILQHEYRAQE
jgi:histidinol dehydrogenase